MIALKEEKGLRKLRIQQYRKFDPALYLRLLKLSRKLKGKTVFHINATPNGGGVAEMLRTQIPLERSLGLKSRWFTLQAPPDFFEITKKIHNLLQGGWGELKKSEKKKYLAANLKFAQALLKFSKNSSGLFMIHDPQPAALAAALFRGTPAVLRLHLDLTSPDLKVFKFLGLSFPAYRKIVVSNPAFKKAFPHALRSKLAVIPPAIDPFSEKNRPFGLSRARRLLKNFGIDGTRPLFAQVSRFDPWKDPLGVLKIFKIVRQKLPSSQLVLAGFIVAADDPEARRIFEKVKRAAGKIPKVLLFADPRELGKISNDLFINALFTASDAIIQKSKREGFGLTVTEAMWKGKVVVAGRTAGTALQITNGKNGFLVASVPAGAAALLRLVKNKKLRNRLGRQARQSVQKRFLFPRLLLDHLKLYAACYNT